MESKTLGVTWRKGMKATKLLYGLNGYREATLVTITKVDAKTKTIFVDHETGITFDNDGREKENFFPPMRAEITPLIGD
jgi:hypothetical protein